MSKRLEQQPTLRPGFLTPFPFTMSKAYDVCSNSEGISTVCMVFYATSCRLKENKV